MFSLEFLNMLAERGARTVRGFLRSGTQNRSGRACGGFNKRGAVCRVCTACTAILLYAPGTKSIRGGASAPTD